MTMVELNVVPGARRRRGQPIPHDSLEHDIVPLCSQDLVKKNMAGRSRVIQHQAQQHASTRILVNNAYQLHRKEGRPASRSGQYW